MKVLNRIVNFYIEFAELQALERRAMTMQDWIVKLDEFLKISGRELLHNAGSISATDAKAKAELEYKRYRKRLDAQPQRIDTEFEKTVRVLKKLSKPKAGGGKSAGEPPK